MAVVASELLVVLALGLDRLLSGGNCGMSGLWVMMVVGLLGVGGSSVSGRELMF